MYMLLDTMAAKYHLLPSEVFSKATTFDLYVMKRSLSYHMNKNNPDVVSKPKTLSIDQMQAMVNQVKDKNVKS